MTEIMPVPRNSHITVLRPPSIAGGFYFMVDIWLRVCYNRDKIKERKCNDALY